MPHSAVTADGLREELQRRRRTRARTAVERGDAGTSDVVQLEVKTSITRKKHERS